MIIAPPVNRLKHRPIALLIPGYHHLRIETDSGVVEVQGSRQCYDALEAHQGHALYVAGGLTKIRHTTGARVWTADVWRGKATCMKLDGTKVKVQSLRGTLEGSPDPYGDLSAVIGWLHGRGVRAAGISGMGWALWRSTLTAPVEIGANARVGRSALYGGRQQIRDKRSSPTQSLVYSHMVAVDIARAYPHAMGAAPFALGLRRVAPTTDLDPTVPGIAQATVSTDADWPYGPLPERLAPDLIRFTVGPGIKGSWPWGELAAAAALGADVRVSKVWAPTQMGNLFGPEWLALVDQGNNLPTKAAQRLAKALINATWGMFGMTGDQKAVIRWEDEAGFRPVMVNHPKVKLPHAMTSHIAAETASRVRVRMLNEGLYGDWGPPVHVDTDGIIVRRSSVKGVPKVAVPGCWRVKATMPKIEIRAPQVYRNTCPDCAPDLDSVLARAHQTHAQWHYVCAGTPPSLAQHLFHKLGRTGTRVAFNGLDMVLPSRHSQDTEHTATDLVEAHSMRAGIDG